MVEMGYDTSFTVYEVHSLFAVGQLAER